ncbi:MAG TPA: hypothetical protein VK426_00225 [Methanobacterium sp.]|nr:hypothetical protein [Methanobacterium sp.]
MVNVLSLEEYLRMWNSITDWQKKNNTSALPNYVDIEGHRVTKAQFLDMLNRMKVWQDAHNGQMASEIGIEGPSNGNDDSKPTIQVEYENAVGSFDNFTGFYNRCKGRGYAHYNNDVYDHATALNRLKNKQGLNCADSAQLAYNLAVGMGYEAKFEHVVCKKSGGHIRLIIKGREFGSNWTRVDMAACISTQSQYALGNVWCADGTVVGYNDSWLLSDDART